MLTTGEVLKKTRLGKQLTLEAVEKATRIRLNRLKSIEDNNWAPFPSKTYILGAIKTYGKFLELDEDKLAAFFRREYEKKEEVHFKTRVSLKYLTPEAKRLFIITVAGIFVIFSIYFGIQMYRFFAPPRVTIIEPKKAEFKKENKIELIGKTEKEATIEINGERVFQDKNDLFRINIPLVREKNIVTIEVTGANGKKTVVKKVFIRKS